MECMCAQSRPWFMLSCERVFKELPVSKLIHCLLELSQLFTLAYICRKKGISLLLWQCCCVLTKPSFLKLQVTECQADLLLPLPLYNQHHSFDGSVVIQ